MNKLYRLVMLSGVFFGDCYLCCFLTSIKTTNALFLSILSKAERHSVFLRGWVYVFLEERGAVLFSGNNWLSWLYEAA